MSNKKDLPNGNFYQLHNGMHKILKPYEFFVMCVLIQHSNEDGYCFPSEVTIAGGQMKRQTVGKYVEVLENKGYLEVEGRKSTSCKTNLGYYINFGKLYDDIQHVNGINVSSDSEPTTNLPVETTRTPNGRVNPEHVNLTDEHVNLTDEHVNETDTNHINRTIVINHSNTFNQSNSSSSLNNLKDTKGTGNEDTGNVSLKVESDVTNEKLQELWNKGIEDYLALLSKQCPHINVSEEYEKFKGSLTYGKLARKTKESIEQPFKEWCKSASNTALQKKKLANG